ncbi:MAG TPA: class I SAM-dependent methyltransferase [Rectinemataceae bacterium]|nr:class I SAM-dependent methyltransferase [Rectinemataceae bacterium]
MKTFATLPRPEALRPIPCALCGQEGFAPLWDCGAFSFVRCRSCGLVQQNPQPEAPAVAARYDSAYLEYEAENQLVYRDLELLALAELGVLDSLKRRAAQSSGPARLLDVGCATGALLDSFRSIGCEVMGVELCAPAAEYGRSRYRLPIHPGTLESAAFPDASFDLVHASHLIEHLNDPGAWLDEVGRVLAPDGELVLTTPKVDGFQARLLGSEWRSAIYDHLYLFSLRSLVRLLGTKGFRLERSITWGGWAKGLRPAFLKKPLDALAKRWGLGDVMALVARKAHPRV